MKSGAAIIAVFAASVVIAIMLALLFSEIGNALEPNNSTLFGQRCTYCGPLTFADVLNMVSQISVLTAPIFVLGVIPMAVSGISFFVVVLTFKRIPVWAPAIVAPLCSVAFWFQDNVLMGAMGGDGGMFSESVLAYCWTTFFFLISFYVVWFFSKAHLKITSW
jgi:hypothetical protein